MNSKLIYIALLLVSFFLYGEEKEKKYTQEEFDKKVEEEVTKQVLRLKRTSVARLTNEVLEKERKLKEREDQLTERAHQIEVAEKNLSQKVSSFEKIQKKVLGCMDANKENETKRVTQLVTMISNMKPVKAAEVLSVQDSKISIKILERIDPKKASKIFNSMDKEVSARLQKQYLNMRR